MPLSARPAKRRSYIPIVMAGSVSDPVATGLIESFSHPGRNLTGAFVRLHDLNSKRLQLLNEMLPGVSRVAVLSDKLGRSQFDDLVPVARTLNTNLESVDVTDAYDFEVVFKQARKKQAGAILLLGSPAFRTYVAPRSAYTALHGGLPVISPYNRNNAARPLDVVRC